ncbi:MAG: hypothetical protein P8Z81_10980 [Deinococcales bacterium]|jgi:hypothetical protein
MIRTAAPPRNLIIGVFMFLAAVVSSVAPMPLLFRSLGVLIFAYLAFAEAGMPAAYLTALLAPVAGLLSGDPGWLTMLPIVISANLLAMLALEYSWPYVAIVLSPALEVVPMLFVASASKKSLFLVTLPWAGEEHAWIVVHGLVAFAGVLVALYLHRRRSRAP